MTVSSCFVPPFTARAQQGQRLPWKQVPRAGLPGPSDWLASTVVCFLGGLAGQLATAPGGGARCLQG